jgi:hypothetical protein
MYLGIRKFGHVVNGLLDKAIGQELSIKGWCLVWDLDEVLRGLFG